MRTCVRCVRSETNGQWVLGLVGVKMEVGRWHQWLNSYRSLLACSIYKLAKRRLANTGVNLANKLPLIRDGTRYRIEQSTNTVTLLLLFSISLQQKRTVGKKTIGLEVGWGG